MWLHVTENERKKTSDDISKINTFHSNDNNNNNNNNNNNG